MTQPLDLAAIRAQGKIPKNNALLPIIRLSDLPDQPPERKWIMPKFIPHDQVTLLTGDGGTGKSLLCQQLCTTLALGLPFFGIDNQQCKTMYVTCEDDRGELHRRQDAICKALGSNFEAIGEQLKLIPLIDSPDCFDFSLATYDNEGKARPTDLYKSLLNEAIESQSKLIVLDNIAHFYAGIENDRNQVQQFLNLMTRLAKAIDGAVLLIGHPPKSGAQYSGSTAWENQVRSRLYMAKPDPTEDGYIDADARSLSIAKANYARIGETINLRWHNLAYVALDAVQNNDIRQQEDALIQENQDNDIFLNCLKMRNDTKRAVSEKHSPTYAPTVFAKMPESKRIGKKRLEAAMDRLFRTGSIERGELWTDDHRKPVYGLHLAVAANAANANHSCPQDDKETPENSQKQGAANGAGNTCGQRKNGIFQDNAETRENSQKQGAANGAANAANTHYISKDIYPGADSPPDDISDLGFQSWLNGEDFADGDQATDPPHEKDD